MSDLGGTFARCDAVLALAAFALCAAPARPSEASTLRRLDARLAANAAPSQIVVTLERRASVRFDSVSSRLDGSPVVLWELEGKSLNVETAVENRFDVRSGDRGRRLALVAVASEFRARLGEEIELAKRDLDWSAASRASRAVVEIKGIDVPRAALEARLSPLDLVPAMSEWGVLDRRVDAGAPIELDAFLSEVPHANGLAAIDPASAGLAWLAQPSTWLAGKRATFSAIDAPTRPTTFEAHVGDLVLDPSSVMRDAWSRAWARDAQLASVAESVWMARGRARVRVTPPDERDVADGARARLELDARVEGNGVIVAAPAFPARYELEFAATVHVEFDLRVREVR